MSISWAGTPWAISTAYAVGARVVNPPSAGAAPNVYQATTGGTSASSGAGPTITSGSVADGTVTWLCLGPDAGSVVSVAPELSTLDVPAQILFLAMAERRLDALVWGDLYDDGERYLAGHFAQLARLRGHGPLTAERVGDLGRSYAAMTGVRALDLTACGRAYRELVRLLPTALGLVP